MNQPSPKDCVILVPCGEAIAATCEQSLRILEARGYTVRRVRGFSQIDVARNCIASTAVQDGFAETMWIDSDIGFDPDDVEQLRSHQLPVVAGLYAKKARREFACKFLPGTTKVQFGGCGGVLEIMYAATGFLLVRRQVYLDMQSKLSLPICNTMFGEAVTPWFQPLVKDYRGGHWYLGEDFAFCERIRLAGYKIYADTTIRLQHYGNYPYGWEDAGRDIQRFSSHEFHLGSDETAWHQQFCSRSRPQFSCCSVENPVHNLLQGVTKLYTIHRVRPAKVRNHTDVRAVSSVCYKRLPFA